MFKPTESKREIWFNKENTFAGDEYHLVGILVSSEATDISSTTTIAAAE